MDWTRGYSARWRAYEVDRDTWADGAPIEGVDSAQVERDATGEAPLLESGTISLTTRPGADFGERYVRLVMVAEQDGGKERVEVCTLLCSASSGSVDRGADVVQLDGRSVLYPASVALMDRGAYVPKGMDGAQWAVEQLEGVLQAPVRKDASFTLSEHYVLDVGCSVLQAVWLVLAAGGRTLRIDGNGTVHVCDRPTEPALELTRARARLLRPGVTHALDWSGVPNRYVAVDGSKTAVATNTLNGSPTSTVTRGYRHDVVDDSPVLVDGESLTDYARRRLEELSTVPDTRSYAREWWPGVTVGSLVRGSVSSDGLDGDMRVTRQSLACGRGITVTEESTREVSAWTAI